jgi:quercetin dioxygenase-like cupin family protein
MCKSRLPAAFLGFLCLTLFTHEAVAQAAAEAAGQNVTDMKFVAFPGMPTCSTASVLSGNPGKGSSIVIAKAKSGCLFPWHWHTPAEHVMMVSGTARVEMKDAKPVTLQAGGFAVMPSHHVHQFNCAKTCLLYIYSDAAFDMHYVDDKGQEISPGDALKKVKETAVQAPK